MALGASCLVITTASPWRAISSTRPNSFFACVAVNRAGAPRVSRRMEWASEGVLRRTLRMGGLTMTILANLANLVNHEKKGPVTGWLLGWGNSAGPTKRGQPLLNRFVEAFRLVRDRTDVFAITAPRFSGDR